MTGIYPRRFGKYILLKPLAKGGMGEIYLAAGGDVGGFEKLCVIKKVLTEKADRNKANRFLDEAKVVLRLSHSALVTTFDVGQVNGEFYIAMELVEGKDLREVWNRCVRTRERIPLDVALHVVREVARALVHVHGHGNLKLVHRDVAPPNILLAYSGDVKLADFGLARSVLKQEHTAPGVVFGRAAYLAPEQARGEIADARTDVYTLGIVLWELLTGQQCLQVAGLDPAVALALVRHPKVPPPSARAAWIPASLDQVVLRALAPDRKQRYSSADEFRQGLADVIAQIAPRADAARVAEFLRAIYSETIEEEHVERERMLREEVPKFRALTPQTPLAGPSPPFVSTPVGRELSRPSRIVPPPVIAQMDMADSSESETVVRRPSARALASLATPAPEPIFAAPFRVIGTLFENEIGGVYTAHRLLPDGRRAEASVRLVAALAGLVPDAIEQWRRDARVAARVKHPQIADPLDLGVTRAEVPYAVIDSVRGWHGVARVVSKRRFAYPAAVEVARRVCLALQVAHDAGVIHGTLRPDNILLHVRNGAIDSVKILDFGWAQVLRDEIGRRRRPTRDRLTLVLDHLSPEQRLGRAADARSDVHAVARILYALLCGLRPQDGASGGVFDANRDLAALRAARPDLPTALGHIIVEAMAPDPDHRPVTAGELEGMLGGVAKSGDRLLVTPSQTHPEVAMDEQTIHDR